MSRLIDASVALLESWDRDDLSLDPAKWRAALAEFRAATKTANRMRKLRAKRHGEPE